MAKGFKTGGRSKGTPNRLTCHARAMLLNALEPELAQLTVLLAALQPRERIDSLCRLLPLVLPRMTPIDALEADQQALRTSEELTAALADKNRREAAFECLEASLVL